jgi:hypothetical protein
MREVRVQLANTMKDRWRPPGCEAALAAVRTATVFSKADPKDEQFSSRLKERLRLIRPRSTLGSVNAVSILKPVLSWCLLWFQHVALVDPATSREPVAYHFLSEQKNDHYQQD